VDFVVVGIFVGAIIVGAGAAVRDILPRQRPRLTRRDRKPVEPETIAKAWRRFCQSAGVLMITMGLIVILCTVVAIVLSLSDRTGWILVGASSGLAAAVIGVSAFMIPNHYRRGGFDPVLRTVELRAPSPAVTRNGERRLGSPRLESSDDLFTDAIQIPVTSSVGNAEPLVPDTENESVDIAEAPEIGPPIVTAPAADSREAEPPSIPSHSPESESEIPDRRPAFDARREPVLEQAPLPEEARPARVMRPIDDPPAPGPTPPQPAPVSFELESARLLMPVDPILEAPLIDPDEELPAWNAAPRSTSPPTPYIPPSNQDAADPESAAGFASSLFADLETPVDDAAAEANGTGPFRSRLLNELTGDSTESSGAVADVLLEEFSLPSQDNPPGGRDANNDR
jgi:hypothetical protein